MADAGNWLHGRLDSDHAYLAEWSEYLSFRLDDGFQIDEADLMAQRLRVVALEAITQMKISLSAGANLTLIARFLRELCAAFRVSFPNGDAVRARVGVIHDPARLSRTLFALAHNGDDRSALVVSNYWTFRREARQAFEHAHDPDSILGWPQLHSAWFQAMVAERIVYLNCPASLRDGSAPDPRVVEHFSEDDRLILEKMDAELEESFADVFTAMTLFATDEAQTAAHEEVLRSHAQNGRLESRRLLREMHRDFRVTPWNFQSWDAELKLTASQ